MSEQAMRAAIQILRDVSGPDPSKRTLKRFAEIIDCEFAEELRDSARLDWLDDNSMYDLMLTSDPACDLWGFWIGSSELEPQAESESIRELIDLAETVCYGGRRNVQ